MMKNKDKYIRKNKSIDSNVFFITVSSFFVSCMLFMNMRKPSFKPICSVKILNYIFECIRNFSSSFDNVFLQISILCVAFFLLSRRIGSLNIERLKFSRIFSLFIGVMWTFGKSFAITNDLHLLVASPGQLVKSIIFCWGSCYIADNLLHLFYYLLEKRPDFSIRNIRLKNGKSIPISKVFDLWDKHPFAFPLVFLLVVWAPYTVLSYPGNMCTDAYVELCQFFGSLDFTAHHPPFYTLLLGYFVKLGKFLFGSSNIGLFIYILFQYVICAAVMSYTLLAMKKIYAPRWLKLLSIFVYGFMPHFTSYVSLAIKDVLYCMAFVVFMTQIILMFAQKKKFWTIGNIILTVFSMTFAILLRNNGKHALLPVVIAIIIKFIFDFRKNEFSAEYLCKGVFMLIVPIILSSCITNFMMDKYNIADGSIREVLSLPFQQTARYVRDYSDEVTPGEREAIDAILDYDRLGELYNEKISDPVKTTYKPEKMDSKAKEMLLNYFKVWLVQFTKHPICYFEATLNQNYYIVYPFDETLYMYTSTSDSYVSLTDNKDRQEKYMALSITEYEPFTNAQLIFSDSYKLVSRMPFLGVLCSNAFYVLALMAVLIYAINKKNYNVLIISIPLVMTVLIIIASPVIAHHPRYAFPISYAVPLFVAYYLFATAKPGEKKSAAPKNIKIKNSKKP